MVNIGLFCISIAGGILVWYLLSRNQAHNHTHHQDRLNLDITVVRPRSTRAYQPHHINAHCTLPPGPGSTDIDQFDQYAFTPLDYRRMGYVRGLVEQGYYSEF